MCCSALVSARFLPAACSLYRLAGSGTGGMPGTVAMTGAGVAAGERADGCASLGSGSETVSRLQRTSVRRSEMAFKEVVFFEGEERASGAPPPCGSRRWFG